jgi:hypothetical protein
MSQTPRKRLYFDFRLGSLQDEGGSFTRRIFNCTQFTAGTPGDRYGGLLQALESLTIGSLPAIKAQRAVRAYVNLTFSGASSVKAFPVTANFIGPTPANATGPVQLLPYPANPILAGSEAIYGTAGQLRHFAVLVRLAPSVAFASTEIAGTLFVDRMHTVEV